MGMFSEVYKIVFKIVVSLFKVFFKLVQSLD